MKFSEMSQQEINKMSAEEFSKVPPGEKRSCHDCRFLFAKLSWWCGNKEAVKFRGTQIPGCIKCKFWEPKKIPDRPLWYFFPLKFVMAVYTAFKRSLQAVKIFSQFEKPSTFWIAPTGAEPKRSPESVSTDVENFKMLHGRDWSEESYQRETGIK